MLNSEKRRIFRKQLAPRPGTFDRAGSRVYKHRIEDLSFSEVRLEHNGMDLSKFYKMADAADGCVYLISTTGDQIIGPFSEAATPKELAKSAYEILKRQDRV